MVQEQQPATSKDEQIGYHKGAISTLLAERNELVRIVQITESFINAHVAELEKLGVKISREDQKFNEVKK
ncbi:hypothetical protein J4461_04380 [Candidatus Pacearchaeota archaeon]|nr:hypothetical protein [Candidatus Pacearchaeota archaeon]